MKYCSYLVLIFFGCNQTIHEPSNAAKTQPPHIEDSILVRVQTGAGNESTDSCVYVSYELERDSSYNRLLRKYLCEYQFGYDSAFSLETMAALANRESFFKIILLFFDGDKYSRVRYYGERNRMDDLRRGYLFPIRSCCPNRLHLIADSLLQRNYFDGVECLWELTDMSKLPSLDGYLLRMDTMNFYRDAEVATVFHVIRNDSLRDAYLAKAEKITDHKSELAKLRSLMAQKRAISLGQFNALMYGEK
jgi:hypothetical protein